MSTSLLPLDLRQGYEHVLERAPVASAVELLRSVPPNDLQLEEEAACVSLAELAGLGREIWQHVDARRYLDELRDGWDAR